MGIRTIELTSKVRHSGRHAFLVDQSSQKSLGRHYILLGKVILEVPSSGYVGGLCTLYDRWLNSCQSFQCRAGNFVEFLRGITYIFLGVVVIVIN